MVVVLDDDVRKCKDLGWTTIEDKVEDVAALSRRLRGWNGI